MRRIYGRFCSRHNEAVNFYKDLMTKDKRFKAFIKVRFFYLKLVFVTVHTCLCFIHSLTLKNTDCCLLNISYYERYAELTFPVFVCVFVLFFYRKR